MSVSLSRSFPIETGVDLDFRPSSYIADWSPTAAAVQNIVGEERRERVHQRMAAGALRAPIPERLLADHLPRRLREKIVALNPARNVSGEYLPPYELGENEIARIVLSTTPRLVYSLRAWTNMLPGQRPHFGKTTRRTGEDNKVYRLVGEGGVRFTIPSPRSVGILSMGELVQVIDRVQAPHLEDLPAHLPFPEALVWWRSHHEHDGRALQRFVRVSSVVYPELGAFYRQRLRWWVASRLASRSEQLPCADSLDRAMEQAWRQAR